jgi:phosphorylase kinase alpha/beta subunit
VVAGIEALLSLTREAADLRWREPLGSQITTLAGDLAARGRGALDAILPCECAQTDAALNRRYDSALLFLLFPLDVIREQTTADAVLDGIAGHLAGDHGIRRYLGDSYWAPDYDRRLSPADRTRDFSDDIDARDALLTRIGDEAQWCLFDLIVSAYYGRRFRETGSLEDRRRQTLHFNRSLAQITSGWRCAELYYLRDGEYVPNPHVPLQWTQANLVVAVEWMRATTAFAD